VRVSQGFAAVGFAVKCTVTVTALLDGLRRAETIGRPVGDAAFIAGLEEATNRPLRPGRRGPKPKDS